MKKRIIIEIISALLAILFLYAALSKILEYNAFILVIKKIPFLTHFATIAALLIPVTEITIAILLLFIPGAKLPGLYASSALIGLFTLYLIGMIIFLPDLPCNCGGVIKSLTWKQHIFFNLFFLLLSLSGIILYRKGKRILYNPPP